MANTLVTPTWVTNETALRFMNSVKGVANFNRSYDDRYRQSGAKIGSTVLARLPQQYSVRRGQAWSPQALYDQTVPITLSYQTGVDFEWSTVQETTELDRIREAAAMVAGVDVCVAGVLREGITEIELAEGQRLWVRATPDSVCIYANDDRVATHPRGGSGPATNEAHLPEHRRDLRHRDRTYWVQRANAIDPVVGEYVVEVFGSEDVLSKLRVV